MKTFKLIKGIIVLILYIIGVVFCLTSCGPSAEERAAAKYAEEQDQIKDLQQSNLAQYTVLLEFCDCRDADTITCMYSHTPTNNDILYDHHPAFYNQENKQGIVYLNVCNIKVLEAIGIQPL